MVVGGGGVVMAVVLKIMFTQAKGTRAPETNRFAGLHRPVKGPRVPLGLACAMSTVSRGVSVG